VLKTRNRAPGLGRVMVSFLLALALVQRAQSAGAETDLVDKLRRDVESAMANSEPAAALALLQKNQDLIGDDPDMQYLLGVVALEAGELLLALEALEKAVLLRPAFAGAWLDLAIAHARLGDRSSARAILDHVEAEFQPPPALQQQIRSARLSLDAPPAPAPGSAWHGDLLVLGGVSSNANAGLAVGGFSLTPAGGDIQRVAVAPEQRPRADAEFQTRSVVYRDFSHESGSVTGFVAAVRGRLFVEQGDFGSSDIGVGVNHLQPLASGRAFVLGGNARFLTLGGRDLGTFFGASLGLQQRLSPECSLVGLSEYESRLYRQPAYVDANLFWFGAVADCRRGAHTLVVGGRAGLDVASGTRAGGDTARAEASVLWRWTAGNGWRSEMLAYMSYAQDSEGYSPLLENGSRRRTWRAGQRLSVSRDLAPSGRWRAVVEIENTRDLSNLPIFRLNELQVTAGLRHVF
jgi:hypothetical protein